MYQSPIEVIYKEMRTEFENNVYKAIQDYGVCVDKEELIKALQYDRGQYEKGYADGLLHQKDEWISVDERLPEPNKECLVAAKVGERMVVDLGERVRCFDCRTMEHSYALSITNDWDEGEGCEITHWMPLPEAPMMKGSE